MEFEKSYYDDLLTSMMMTPPQSLFRDDKMADILNDATMNDFMDNYKLFNSNNKLIDHDDDDYSTNSYLTTSYNNFSDTIDNQISITDNREFSSIEHSVEYSESKNDTPPSSPDTPPTSPEYGHPIYVQSNTNSINDIIDTGQINLIQGTILPVGEISVKSIPTYCFEKTIIPCNIMFKNNTTSSLKSSTLNKRVLPKINSVPIKTELVDNSTYHFNGHSRRTRDFQEQLLKKQQRMIKNRKSALLSRKKKKDYVTALENQVTDLVKLNNELKIENQQLRSQLNNVPGCFECKRKYFSVNNSTGRKNTAVLLAMVFMVSLNFGAINNFFVKSPIRDIDTKSFSKTDHFGRNLLWISENSSNNMGKVHSKIEAENRTKYPTCPLPINQTENIRMETELRKWIVVNRFSNLSALDEDPLVRFKSIESNINFYDEAIYSYVKASQQNKFFRQRKPRTGANSRSKKAKTSAQIQIFTANSYKKYANLFKDIKRSDDTFYVVSFNSDHILLPAATHNKSSRPKMAFMLPAGYPSLGGEIALMRIDCEVVNTSLVQIKEKNIPQHLRTWTTKANEHPPFGYNTTYGPEQNAKQQLDIMQMPKQNYDKHIPFDNLYKSFLRKHLYNNSLGFTKNFKFKRDQIIP